MIFEGEKTFLTFFKDSDERVQSDKKIRDLNLVSVVILNCLREIGLSVPVEWK